MKILVESNYLGFFLGYPKGFFKRWRTWDVYITNAIFHQRLTFSPNKRFYLGMNRLPRSAMRLLSFYLMLTRFRNTNLKFQFNRCIGKLSGSLLPVYLKIYRMFNEGIFFRKIYWMNHLKNYFSQTAFPPEPGWKFCLCAQHFVAILSILWKIIDYQVKKNWRRLKQFY